MNDDDDSDLIQMRISLPTDREACLRHRCPNCEQDFKVDVEEELLDDILGWSVGRVLLAHGVTTNVEEGPDAGYMTCPYCDNSDPPQEFLHPEFQVYLYNLAMREVVEPMVSRMFDDAFGGMKSNRFIKITHESGPRSPRPVVGPELPDMVLIRCIACTELFKVREDWRGSLSCPSCAIHLLAM